MGAGTWDSAQLTGHGPTSFKTISVRSARLPAIWERWKSLPQRMRRLPSGESSGRAPARMDSKAGFLRATASKTRGQDCRRDAPSTAERGADACGGGGGVADGTEGGAGGKTGAG